MQQDVGYQSEWHLHRAIPDYIAWLRYHPESPQRHIQKEKAQVTYAGL